MRKNNQMDHVKEMKGIQPEVVSVKVTTPGLDQLHLRNFDEIAETLTNVLRSQANIQELRWKIGQGIELICQNPDL